MNDIVADKLMNREFVGHFKNLTEGRGMNVNQKSREKLVGVLKNTKSIITTNKLPRESRF